MTVLQIHYIHFFTFLLIFKVYTYMHYLNWKRSPWGQFTLIFNTGICLERKKGTGDKTSYFLNLKILSGWRRDCGRYVQNSSIAYSPNYTPWHKKLFRDSKQVESPWISTRFPTRNWKYCNNFFLLSHFFSFNWKNWKDTFK